MMMCYWLSVLFMFLTTSKLDYEFQFPERIKWVLWIIGVIPIVNTLFSISIVIIFICCKLSESTKDYIINDIKKFIKEYSDD